MQRRMGDMDPGEEEEEVIMDLGVEEDMDMDMEEVVGVVMVMDMDMEEVVGVVMGITTKNAVMLHLNPAECIAMEDPVKIPAERGVDSPTSTAPKFLQPVEDSTHKAAFLVTQPLPPLQQQQQHQVVLLTIPHLDQNASK